MNPVESLINNANLSLWWRLFQVSNPSRLLCARQLAEYILYKRTVRGTLLHRIVQLNVSPISCLMSKQWWVDSSLGTNTNNGVSDSLRYLIMQENFIKPYSDEHVLATLLTKAF